MRVELLQQKGRLLLLGPRNRPQLFLPRAGVELGQEVEVVAALATQRGPELEGAAPLDPVRGGFARGPVYDRAFFLAAFFLRAGAAAPAIFTAVNFVSAPTP